MSAYAPVGGPIAARADAPASLEVPSAHLGLTWRPLGLDDVDALHALIERIEAADAVPRRTVAAEVGRWLAVPWHDLSADSLAGFDHTGRLRAYGVVEIRPGEQSCVRAFLAGGVDPEWRGGGLGRALVAWMEGRGRQMLAATGRTGRARLAAYVAESARAYRQLYAAAGFSPIRWYAELHRDLRDPLPDAGPPTGVNLVEWRPELDDTVRLAHNAAFADHWGAEPQTPESWAAWTQGPHAAPSWSLVAQDDDGAVVGYLLSEHHGAEVQGFDSGFTSVVGVLPHRRRQGLGTALLTAALHRYREAGMPAATLEVDSAEPSGSPALFARLGYRPNHGSVLYSVEI